MKGSTPHRPSRGWTLPELLAGIAIGLIVLAAAALHLVHPLRVAAETTLHTRLAHDLDAMLGLIQAQVRRAGHGGPQLDDGWLAPPDHLPAAWISPSHELTLGLTLPAAGGESWLRRGLRLQRGVLQMRLHAGASWQALNDPQAVTVTDFSVRPGIEPIDLTLACAAGCGPGPPDCTPHQLVQALHLQLSAHATRRPEHAITRSATVHLRNDELTWHCPHTP